MVVEPGSERVVIGTDQMGVLVTDDGGQFFHVSDSGFRRPPLILAALLPSLPVTESAHACLRWLLREQVRSTITYAQTATHSRGGVA